MIYFHSYMVFPDMRSHCCSSNYREAQARIQSEFATLPTAATDSRPGIYYSNMHKNSRWMNGTQPLYQTSDNLKQYGTYSTTDSHTLHFSAVGLLSSSRVATGSCCWYSWRCRQFSSINKLEETSPSQSTCAYAQGQQAN